MLLWNENLVRRIKLFVNEEFPNNLNLETK